MPIVLRPSGDTDLSSATLHAETALPQTIAGLSAGAYQVGRLTWADTPVSVSAAGSQVLPTSQKAMIFGDSRLSVGRSRVTPSWGSGWPASKIARGIDNWLEFLSRRRVQLPSDVNYAVSGDSISEQLVSMETDLAAGAAAGAGFILWLCGVNGIRAGDTGAEAVADATTAIGLMKATGLPIIVISDWPAFDGADFTSSQGQWDAQLALRSYYLSLADDPQITVVDAWEIMGGSVAAAPHSAPPATQPFFEDEWLHQQNGGAQAIAAAILPTITGWFPDAPALPDSDLALSPLGTTGGSVSGGVSGTVPTDWSMTGSNISGLTVTGAVGTLAHDGAPAHVITASGTAPAGDAYVRGLEAGFTVTEGEVYRISADLEVAAGTAGVDTIMLGALAAFGGSASTYDLATWSTTDDVFPSVAVAGRYETLPFTIPTGVTSLRLRWRIDFRTGEAVTLNARIGNIRILRDA